MPTISNAPEIAGENLTQEFAYDNVVTVYCVDLGYLLQDVECSTYHIGIDDDSLMKQFISDEIGELNKIFACLFVNYVVTCALMSLLSWPCLSLTLVLLGLGMKNSAQPYTFFSVFLTLSADPSNCNFRIS